MFDRWSRGRGRGRSHRGGSRGREECSRSRRPGPCCGPRVRTRGPLPGPRRPPYAALPQERRPLRGARRESKTFPGLLAPVFARLRRGVPLSTGVTGCEPTVRGSSGGFISPVASRPAPFPKSCASAHPRNVDCCSRREPLASISGPRQILAAPRRCHPSTTRRSAGS